MGDVSVRTKTIPSPEPLSYKDGCGRVSRGAANRDSERRRYSAVLEVSRDKLINLHLIYGTSWLVARGKDVVDAIALFVKNITSSFVAIHGIMREFI